MLTTLAVAGSIFTLAGTGTGAPTRDGAPATRAGLSASTQVAAEPDGGFLVAEPARVWRVAAQGASHAVAGTGGTGLSGDGGPALRARIRALGVAALPGGGFLFSDSLH